MQPWARRLHTRGAGQPPQHRQRLRGFRERRKDPWPEERRERGKSRGGSRDREDRRERWSGRCGGKGGGRGGEGVRNRATERHTGNVSVVTASLSHCALALHYIADGIPPRFFAPRPRPPPPGPRASPGLFFFSGCFSSFLDVFSVRRGETGVRGKRAQHVSEKSRSHLEQQGQQNAPVHIRWH